MNPRLDKQDAIAADLLEWAFTGKTRLSQSQRDQVSGITRRARMENRESAGKRRSRLWRLGPVWARRFA